MQAWNFTQEWTVAHRFSIILAQLQKSSFLEHIPVVDSASVAHSKGSTHDVIQSISYQLQSKWLQSLNSATKKALVFSLCN